MKLVGIDSENIIKMESIIVDERNGEHFVNILTPKVTNTLFRIIEEKSITKEYFSFIVIL